MSTNFLELDCIVLFSQDSKFSSFGIIANHKVLIL